MHRIAVLLVVAVALGLSLEARAGEGCAESKEAVTAAMEASDGASHAGACTAACAEAAAVGGSCGCNHAVETSSASVPTQTQSTPLPEPVAATR
jgi:hypothetical protein